MSKEELKEYYKWFMAVMPNRIVQLEKIINATHGVMYGSILIKIGEMIRFLNKNLKIDLINISKT